MFFMSLISFNFEQISFRVLVMRHSGCSFMIQVARAILENPKDKTKVHLIYANVTFEDILLKVLLLLYHISSIVISACVWSSHSIETNFLLMHDCLSSLHGSCYGM